MREPIRRSRGRAHCSPPARTDSRSSKPTARRFRSASIDGDLKVLHRFTIAPTPATHRGESLETASIRSEGRGHASFPGKHLPSLHEEPDHRDEDFQVPDVHGSAHEVSAPADLAVPRVRAPAVRPRRRAKNRKTTLSVVPGELSTTIFRLTVTIQCSTLHLVLVLGDVLRAKREPGENPGLPRSGKRERRPRIALAFGAGKRWTVGIRRKPERSQARRPASIRRREKSGGGSTWKPRGRRVGPSRRQPVPWSAPSRFSRPSPWRPFRPRGRDEERTHGDAGRDGDERE